MCRMSSCGFRLQNTRTCSTVYLPRSNTQLKKQPFKKKNVHQENGEFLKISAFSTAEEFDINSLRNRLKLETYYKFTKFNKELDSDNVIHMVSQDASEFEPKDIFIFREGSLVLWNFNEKETSDVLNFLREFHIDGFSQKIVENENEVMPYVYSHDSTKTCIRYGRVILRASENETLEKFAISNAMALSVHLGAYEYLLNEYIESMFPVTEDLKIGKTIKMSKKEVLRKMGQLFALRHVINLSSDLLDTPDFYWDREELETLYQQTFNYFCITRRTKVMNEKINHCIELVDLLATQLSDAHHIRLEWMIIILIMVEVGFEILHYLDKYWPSLG